MRTEPHALATPAATLRRVLLVTVAVAAVAGCDSGSGSGRQRDVSKVAVRPAGEGREQALATGTLRGDPASGCLWLETKDGRATSQVLLQGKGYAVDFAEGPAVVTRDGKTVAVLGEAVELGGGVGAASDRVKGCPVDLAPFVGYFEDK